MMYRSMSFRYSKVAARDLGRRIERGLIQSSLLSQTLASRLSGEAERESLSLVLQSVDSLVTFRRRYRSEPFLAGVLELLLWDDGSPRSLLYQLRTARRHFAELPHADHRGNAQRLLLDAEARLRAGEATVEDLRIDAQERQMLIRVLREMAGDLAGVSDAITHAWFTHVQELHALRPSPVEA